MCMMMTGLMSWQKLWALHMTFVDVDEALGLFHVLQWLQDMWMDGVDFVVDSQTTADPFNSVRINVTKFGHIITTCRSLVSSHFANSRVEFIRRQANMVAHALALEATLLASITIYLEIPHCIAILLFNEMLIRKRKKKKWLGCGMKML